MVKAETVHGFRRAFRQEPWKKIWLWSIAKVILQQRTKDIPSWSFIQTKRNLFKEIISHCLATEYAKNIPWQEVHRIWNEKMLELRVHQPTLDYTQITWSINMLDDREIHSTLLMMRRDQHGVPTWKKFGYTQNDMEALFSLKDNPKVLKRKSRWDSDIDWSTDDEDSTDWGDFSD